MPTEFLKKFSGRRMNDYGAPPEILRPSAGSAANDSTEIDVDDSGADVTEDLAYEVPADDWIPMDTSKATVSADWPLRPVRFIDGKDVGRTIAWLRTPEGRPAPLRLAQVGAVALRDAGGELRRETILVDRIVSMPTDLFPWDEVERFARDLQADGYRLVRCRKPGVDDNPYDFGRLRDTANKRTTNEMLSLEKVVLRSGPRASAIVDGRLETKAGAFGIDDAIFGIIKSHGYTTQLSDIGWKAFYDLAFGERTPAFVLRRTDDPNSTFYNEDDRAPQRKLSVVSWYLRLGQEKVDSPERGIVRVETPLRWFEDRAGRDFSLMDRLSCLLCRMRSHDPEYGRASATIFPIQRAEEMLSAQFVLQDTLANRFYRCAGI